MLIAHKIALAPNNAQATYCAKAKIARLHARISNVRNDALHKLTTDLTRRFDTIGIEDLNVRGMMSNHHMARSVADMGFFEFRRQLEYKAAMAGSRIRPASFRHSCTSRNPCSSERNGGRQSGDSGKALRV